MRAVRLSLKANLAALLLLVSASDALPHHSVMGQFDVNKELTIKGAIVKMQWQNPHGWLRVNVTTAAGKSEEWIVEFAAANSLYRQGWRAEDLPAGQMVTVVGLAARNGSNTLAGKRVELADGRTLFADGGKSRP